MKTLDVIRPAEVRVGKRALRAVVVYAPGRYERVPELQARDLLAQGAARLVPDESTDGA